MKRLVFRAGAESRGLMRAVTAIRADAGSDAEPKWVQYFPKGTFHRWDFPNGAITIDDAFCAAVVANWRKAGEPALPVDYFHRGESSNDGLSVGDKVASGWISKLEARGDGVWGLTGWTDAARARILADELRFVSPTWMNDGIDAKTGKPQGPTLLGAALLNDPFFNEMPRVAAAVHPPAVEEQVMNREQLNAMLKTAGIPLAATATDAEALAALNKHLAESNKASDVAAEALKARATVEANEKALKAQLEDKSVENAKLAARVAATEADVAAMKAAALATATDALCARLVNEHRIVAAAQASVKKLVASIGLEEASKFYDTFPKGAVAPGVEVGHGDIAETDALKSVKAAAAAAEKAGQSGSSALRAAALSNPEIVRSLATLSTNPPPTNPAEKN